MSKVHPDFLKLMIARGMPGASDSEIDERVRQAHAALEAAPLARKFALMALRPAHDQTYH